jgi:hypothetical protein
MYFYSEAEKENIFGTADVQVSAYPNVLQERDLNIPAQSAAEKSLTIMLEEAGLADLHAKVPDDQEQPHTSQRVTSQRVTRRGGSESSETPLGSLDRTKVSLGDSEMTTDSKRFIR